nr:hypothetical protein [Pseudomonas sp. BIGb0427]
MEGDEDISLAAARVEVKGQVRLGDGFHAHKAVSFDGARLAGSFDCSRARFADEKKVSLDLEGMHLEGPLILRALDHPLSNATFAGARVGELDDDEDSWGDNIVLNGLDYKALAANAPVNAAFRIKWLARQIPALSRKGNEANPADDFRPQPWRHLQQVFENMGHTAEAREVGVAFERKLRDIGHIGQPPQNWWKWTHPIYTSTARGLHWLYGRLTGFGYRPMQLLVWFLAIWLICAGFYWYAASQQRVFGPSNPLVFQHDAYFDCRPDRGDAWRQANPGLETPPTYYGEGNWYLCQTLREEYTGFSPWPIPGCTDAPGRPAAGVGLGAAGADTQARVLGRVHIIWLEAFRAPADLVRNSGWLGYQLADGCHRLRPGAPQRVVPGAADIPRISATLFDSIQLCSAHWLG